MRAFPPSAAPEESGAAEGRKEEPVKLVTEILGGPQAETVKAKKKEKGGTGMKIPESLRIGGVEYAVRYEENLRLDNDLKKGVIDYLEHTITLSANDATEHQARCQTLLHEILHGIRDYFGMEIENEEDVVDMFAKGLYQVLQDNGARLFDLKEE